MTVTETCPKCGGIVDPELKGQIQTDRAISILIDQGMTLRAVGNIFGLAHPYQVQYRYDRHKKRVSNGN